MATVTAYTAARSLQIENSSVTSGTVDANGNLILTTRGGTPINAGYVVGPAGTPVGSIEQTVKNSSGVAIAKGNVVYISGALDGTALIAKAQANSDATSSKVLGLASEAMNNGETGKVITEGVLTGLDTSAATDGATIWLSATVPGGFVYGDANRPLAPNHSVYVGKVLEAHATLGSIYIRIDNGDQINELHDVTVSSPAATHVLARNSGNTLWQNRALAAADIPSLDAAKITSGTVPIDRGGTGATTVAEAQDSLRVGLVPISPVSVEKAGTGSTATANTLGQVTFSACQSLSLNGVFSAAYKNYRVMIRITDSSATNNTIAMRIRQISDNTSTAYSQGVPLINNSGIFTSLLGNGLQNWAIGQTGSVVRLTTSTIDIFNPFVSTFTTLNMNIIYHSDGAWLAGGGGAYHYENYSANGFSLIPGTAGSTIGGIVQVYGYNE